MKKTPATRKNNHLNRLTNVQKIEFSFNFRYGPKILRSANQINEKDCDLRSRKEHQMMTHPNDLNLA